MYKFKTEKKDLFLDGRKIRYVADKVYVCEMYLSYVLRARRFCSKSLAMRMANYCNSTVEELFVPVQKNK